MSDETFFYLMFMWGFLGSIAITGLPDDLSGPKMAAAMIICGPITQFFLAVILLIFGPMMLLNFLFGESCTYKKKKDKSNT